MKNIHYLTSTSSLLEQEHRINCSSYLPRFRLFIKSGGVILFIRSGASISRHQASHLLHQIPIEGTTNKRRRVSLPYRYPSFTRQSHLTYNSLPGHCDVIGASCRPMKPSQGVTSATGASRLSPARVECHPAK